MQGEFQESLQEVMKAFLMAERSSNELMLAIHALRSIAYQIPANTRKQGTTTKLVPLNTGGFQ
jgi:hypothetical protein